jgi:predicted tellurium resistance membrane protein TerC
MPASRPPRRASEPPASTPSPHKLAEAIWYIVVADVTMSTDNILAIAGASKGNFGLILFGLAVSIPFVVISSNLLAKMMDRFPWTVYLGAAILGKVAGDMMLTDPFVVRTLHPTHAVRYAVEATLFVALFVAGWWMARRRRS